MADTPRSTSPGKGKDRGREEVKKQQELSSRSLSQGRLTPREEGERDMREAELRRAGEKAEKERLQLEAIKRSLEKGGPLQLLRKATVSKGDATVTLTKDNAQGIIGETIMPLSEASAQAEYYSDSTEERPSSASPDSAKAGPSDTGEGKKLEQRSLASHETTTRVGTAEVDFPTFLECYDDVKQYILPDRSGSSSSHPPLGKALPDNMPLEELQAIKEKAQKLQKAADNLLKRNVSAQDLSQFVKQAESAKNDLEAAHHLRPLKHHQPDLAAMQQVVQFGQILKANPDLDFTTLSQPCQELQRLIELKPKMVVAQVQPAIFAEAAKMMDPEALKNFQSLFGDRNAIESELAAKNRDGDSWPIRTGLYTDNILFSRMATKLHDKLAGHEILLNKQLKALLARRQENGKPVILVDFGGAYGLSMIRLAAEHRAAIESGNLVIVVTNLNYLPETRADGDGYSGVAQSLKYDEGWGRNDLSREELDFVQHNQGLVTYIDAIAAELPRNLVQPQEKQPISLGGTVDIIYQCTSIMHTHAPDVALAVFGELLSDQGTFYLEKKNPPTMPDGKRPIQVAGGRTIEIGSRSYKERKKEALEVGVSLLRNQHDMKTIFEDQWYSVLAKSHAPDFPRIDIDADPTSSSD